MLDGRQQLYDRLEDCLEQGGTNCQQEIETIIASLRLRSGAYGVERRNLVNNLFKSIIDLSFPNLVKYLFWACEEDAGIFEPLDEAEYLKYRRMSKYKREEIAAGRGQEAYENSQKQSSDKKQEDGTDEANSEAIPPAINLWLDINVE